MGLQLSFLLPFFLFIFATISTHVSSINPNIGTLGVRSFFKTSEDDTEVLPPDFTTYYYTQTLDHFNYMPESYTTFQQRYVMNFKYWGGPNTSSPIFVYTGAESSIIPLVPFLGYVVDLATMFNGLLLYVEHRYYGDSMPFGSRVEAYRNSSTLGFFSSTQALADYAQLITDVKQNLSAQNSPVIAIGGSYGGMLASWFRLKYPHVVIGALASSAPILYFDDITPQNGYHVVVSNDFKNTSESCYNTIRESWSEIDRVAAEPSGLSKLSQIFTTCMPIESLQAVRDNLEISYIGAAQYDNPPENPVSEMCRAIDGVPRGTDILIRIAAGYNASYGQALCHDMSEFKSSNHSGWQWQTCTEMVFPIGYGPNETMFEASPFDMDNFTHDCRELFGITPRPHWITTEFGGHDIKTVLGMFGSNIIFSNGLRDPYSVGGVLQNISDSLVAVYTEQGAHCLDLHTPTASDPEWLVAQRDTEIKIIQGWLAKYNATQLAS